MYMREQDYHYTHQLRMTLRRDHLAHPPQPKVPDGYRVRQFQMGDQAAYYDLMHAVGWTQWDDALFAQWIERALPQSWFLVTPENSAQLVASAFCTHRHLEDQPFGGELAWIAAHPDHHGKGLGRLVISLVTARFIELGYQNIHLFTEDFRLAALHLYLQMGYQPLLYLPEMHERWQTVCEAINWTFEPDVWEAQ